MAEIEKQINEDLDIQARLKLFNVIEPGSIPWSVELKRYGAVELVERITDGAYEQVNRVSGEIRQALIGASVQELWEEIEAADARFITPASKCWPTALHDLRNPPIGLVIKGANLQAQCVSIVGTRKPTLYGARVASEFASGFADRNWAVVSGGAYGIDTHAHRGCLAAEGSTFAVLASGVSVSYPAGNSKIFSELQESGALVSEVMPKVGARAERFLTRNRLIAALSRGTIVVEAAFRSGSLRTARDAAEIMRPVMAVPGPITSPTSDGCHRLIGERLAEIVSSVPDALELMVPISGQITGTLSDDEI
ncbi:MAG: DNA-protecting protein DprA [Actinobacteria bacterium]|nr:DNA-protecting protein DprA [Actinomycetota bacterium]